MVPAILHHLRVVVGARDGGLHQAGGIGSFAQAQDRMRNGSCDAFPPFREPQGFACLAGGCESQGCCLGSINCNIAVIPQGGVVCGRWRLVPPRQPWCLQHIPSLQALSPRLLSKEMAASNQQQATHSWSANHAVHYSVCSHTASTAQGLCMGVNINNGGRSPLRALRLGYARVITWQRRAAPVHFSRKNWL